MGRKKKVRAKKSVTKTKDKKKKTTRKWKLKKQVPPKNKPKLTDLEDDELVGLSAMELNADDDVETTTSEVSDDEIVEEFEIVSGGADSLESIEDSETFSLGGSGEEGSQLETIRSNPKPRPGWSDKTKPKFSPGDLVVPIELTKKEALEFEPYKIVCPHVLVETYTIKKSRILSESIIYADEIKLAPKDGKPFVSHWDATNPFKVAGLKISCPSNDKK